MELLQLLISLLHILQVEDLQRAPALGLTANQLVDLPEAAGVHQTHLCLGRDIYGGYLMADIPPVPLVMVEVVMCRGITTST